MIQLRDYQRACLENLACDFDAGYRSLLVQAATGTGKTIMFLAWLASVLGDDERALIMAHRSELITQPIEKARRFYPALAERMGIVMAERNDVDAGIVVATVQTLNSNGRINDVLAHGPINCYVVDEAHHDSADTYRYVEDALRAANPDMRKTGWTATPVRTDRDGLVSTTCRKGPYDRMSYRFPVQAAVRRGALCEFSAYAAGIPATFEGIDETESGWDDTQLGDILNVENVWDVVRAAWHGEIDGTPDCSGRQTITFTASVAQAHGGAEYFQRHGVAAEAVDGSTPGDERAAMLERFRNGETQMLLNCAVLCLDSQTEILTDSGWVGINEMTLQHKVANWEQGSIFFDHPKLIVRRDRLPQEKMVSYNSNRMSFRVTEDHRMLCRTSKTGDFLIKHASELVNKSVKVPISGYAKPFNIDPQQPKPIRAKKYRRRISSNSYHLRQNGWGFDESKHEAKRRLDRRLSLRRAAPKELSLAQCALIGFWIGDGSACALQSGGTEYTLVQSMTYENVIKFVDSVLDDSGYDFVRHKYPERLKNGVIKWSLPRGTGFGPQARNGVFDIEPYLDKDGSDLLWGLNEKQFDEFLRGFWFADGDHSHKTEKPRSFRIHNTNLELLSKLQAIATCRGYRASITEGDNHKRNPAHSINYVLYLKKADSYYVGFGDRQIHLEEQHIDEQVWCVTSSTGNIITRRNGNVLVTGNTEGWDAPGASCCLMVSPTKSPLVWVQKAGRILRLDPDDPDKHAVIVDFYPIERGNIFAMDALGVPKAVKDAKEQALEAGVLVGGWSVDRFGRALAVDTDRVVVRMLDLMSRSRFPWTLRGHYATTSLSEDLAACIALPDSDRLEKAEKLRRSGPWGEADERLYEHLRRVRLYRVVRKGWDWEAEPAGHYDDPEEAKKEVDEWPAEEALSSRRSKWRAGPATIKQIGFLRRLQDDIPERPTKGEASQLISEALTIQATKRTESWIERRIYQNSFEIAPKTP